MYRYLIGSYTDTGFDALFKLESSTRISDRQVIRSLRKALNSALESPGFSWAESMPRWSVRVEEVMMFRGTEISLSTHLAENLTEAVRNVAKEDVLLVAYRVGHNDGERYDYRLLAVPKGSKLPPDSSWYQKDTFDKNVNWIGQIDSNSECLVSLPENAKAWDGSQWVPITKLEYHY